MIGVASSVSSPSCPDTFAIIQDMQPPKSNLQPQLLYNGKIVRLEILGDKWEVVRHQDTVTVLAQNEAGQMLLVRQFRPAVGCHTLEAPAGLIDQGETPEQAARRELQEETGFDGQMSLLSRFYASPGFCDEQLYIFAASNLQPSSLPADDDEDIEVLWLSPQQVLDDLREGRVVGSATTVSAATFALLSQAQAANNEDNP